MRLQWVQGPDGGCCLPGVQRRPGTHTEGVEEAPEAADNLLTSMRSSRSVPSLASADLTTPRNLIEVSAWLRQHQDHAPASAGRGLLGRVPSLKSKGESLTAKTSSSSMNRPSLPGRASGSSLKGPTLSGKGESLSTRASSVPSVVSSRGAHHSTNRYSNCLPCSVCACQCGMPLSAVDAGCLHNHLQSMSALMCPAVSSPRGN